MLDGATQHVEHLVSEYAAQHSSRGDHASLARNLVHRPAHVVAMESNPRKDFFPFGRGAAPGDTIALEPVAKRRRIGQTEPTAALPSKLRDDDFAEAFRVTGGGKHAPFQEYSRGGEQILRFAFDPPQKLDGRLPLKIEEDADSSRFAGLSECDAAQSRQD